MDATRFLIEVSETPPTLQECMEFVTHPSCGAVSSFIGTTRDNFENKIVIHLSYESYVPMAIREIQKLCIEALDKFPSVFRIAIVHKLGQCDVGMTSIIICCSSPHRKEALNCVAFLIDDFKARVPIWKKEVYDCEESLWKENSECKIQRSLPHLNE
jgi:molybdopterin synthase catalytic subunit